MSPSRILVSACLLGRKVRYDGSDRLDGDPVLARWRAEGRVVALCPEVAVGFPTPRPPAEIVGEGGGDGVHAGTARILEDTGRDVTDLYRQAAAVALELAQANRCRFAVLTDGSPSCGSTFIYDGRFSGGRTAGRGSTAALLAAHGVEVYPETALAVPDARLRAEEG